MDSPTWHKPNNKETNEYVTGKTEFQAKLIVSLGVTSDSTLTG